MHILEIASFYEPHGGHFVLEQAKALKARGNEVCIIACTQLGITTDKKFYFTAQEGYWHKVSDGIDIYGHYQRNMPMDREMNILNWIKTVNRMYDMYKMDHGKPDVLHAHCCNLAGFAVSYISEREKIPFFITEHLPSEAYEKEFGEGWKKSEWLKNCLRISYKHAACVIPVADELIKDTEQFFGSSYKYHSISNIIDTNFFAFKERQPAEGRPFRFCCLAIADIHRKGYDVLADAWKTMDNCELHIAGQGTKGAKLRRLFKNCKNVTFHGELNKNAVRELLYYCDALVLPSRSEAQPLVILEALSTGIPVVATEVTPQSERVPQACLIAKTGNAFRLAEQLKKCTKVKPSVAFSDAVKAIASPETVAQQLEQLFAAAVNA